MNVVRSSLQCVVSFACNNNIVKVYTTSVSITTQRVFKLFFSLLLSLQMLSCSSSEIRTGDGKVEKEIEEISGVSDESVRKAREKLDASLTDDSSKNKDHSDKKSLNLRELYDLAVEGSERIAIRQEAIRQSLAEQDVLTEQWLPSLSFKYNHTFRAPDHTKQKQRDAILDSYIKNRMLGMPFSTAPPSLIGPPSGSQSILNLHIPLFNGLNDYSNVQSGKAKTKFARWQLKHDIMRLYLDTATLYVGILQLEKSLETREDLHKRTAETLAEQQRRARVGRTKQSDLYATLAVYEKQTAEMETIKTELYKKRESLSVLAGVPSNIKLSDEDDLPTLNTITLDDAEKRIRFRADVAAAKAMLEVNKSQLSRAKGGHLPSVSIDGNYYLDYYGKKSSDTVWQLGVTLPLFSFGATQSQVKVAESSYRQAELQFSSTRKGALQEIRQSYTAYHHSLKEIESYRKALESAESVYQLQVRDYNRKLVTILDIITSLNNLAAMRDQYNQAKLQATLNRIWFGVAICEYPVTSNEEDSQTK